MRADAARREPFAVEACTTALYAAQRGRRFPDSGGGSSALSDYVLHDGPPYANGDLHMGHFLNKVLKDITNRYRLLAGQRIHYVPGWDCHGLPIELKALAEGNDEGSGSGVDATEIRARAEACALRAVRSQQKDFQRWGVMADWSAFDAADADDDHDVRGKGDAAVAASAMASGSGNGTAAGDGVYLTMRPEYEARELGVLGEMATSGLLYRAAKPVYWSPSTRTALAEAELEYVDDHTSQSAFVAFPVQSLGSEQAQSILGPLMSHADGTGSALSAVAWTTTPWTIPANQALCVAPDVEYSVVRTRCAKPAGVGGTTVDAGGAQRLLILASDLIGDLTGRLLLDGDDDLQIVATLFGRDLEGSVCAHPLAPQDAEVDQARPSPILCGSHVTTDAGTGIVHTAPAHGHDDHDVWLAHHGTDAGRESVICPVDGQGRFTADARLASGTHTDLAGKSIFGEGTEAVLGALADADALLAVERYAHRYPYDWRSKQPVIVRCTEQWFVRVGDPALRQAARVALEPSAVQMIPEAGRRRLTAMVESRSDWCISRQRAWGVPIPCFHDIDTGETFLDAAIVDHVQSLVQLHGSGCWWDLPLETLLPPHLREATRADGTPRRFTRGQDTLDVWFDSGVSWRSVLDVRLGAQDAMESGPGGGNRQADLYLEGSDQHRGWFQSSLMTALATQLTHEGTQDRHGQPSSPLPLSQTGPITAPYKCVVTHGFVLDEHGHKMSKSLGNVVTPGDIINGTAPAGGSKKGGGVPKASGKGQNGQKGKKNKSKNKKQVVQWPAYGVDVLRMWVASNDFTRDVLLGSAAVEESSQLVRKLRNVVRFLLGNLADYDPARVSPTGEGGGGGPDGSCSPAAPAAPPPLSPLDRLMLHRVALFSNEVSKAYDSFNYNRVTHLIKNFVANDLSALYFEPVKDRLYMQPADDAGRRATQAVLWNSMEALSWAIAPILPFLVEELSGHLPGSANGRNVFLEGRRLPPTSWTDEKLSGHWDVVHLIRAEVNRLLDQARADGEVSTSFETCLVIELAKDPGTAPIYDALHAFSEDLEDVFATSSVTVVPERSSRQGTAPATDMASSAGVFFDPSSDPLRSGVTTVVVTEDGPELSATIKLFKATAAKCPRCWKFTVAAASDDGTMDGDSASEHVCERCASAISLQDL